MIERRSRQFWWYAVAFVAYFLQLAGGMAVSILFTLRGPETDGLDRAVIIAERFSYFAIGATALTYTFLEGREMWLANRLKEHFRQEGFEAGRDVGRDEGRQELRAELIEARQEAISARREGYEEGYAKAKKEGMEQQNGADDKPAD